MQSHCRYNQSLAREAVELIRASADSDLGWSVHLNLDKGNLGVTSNLCASDPSVYERDILIRRLDNFPILIYSFGDIKRRKD